MLDWLENKKIVVLGLGANNQGLVDFLKKRGINFQVIENWKSWDDLPDLSRFDVIFRTPGLPYNSLPIQKALKEGGLIYSQTKLFFDLCPSPIIGVTGTKGKGTTSTLISKIILAGGKKAWLAGNVGKDPFEFLDDIQPKDFTVLELSSFQLQDLHKSPQIAVVLNITPDHLNHHKDFDEYIRAKSLILENQHESDFAVLNPNLPEWFAILGKSKKIFADPNNYLSWETKLLGKHNFENIAAAVEVAKILGISEEVAKTAVADFSPLPHRLNPIRIVADVTYIDDAYSTNILPVIAGLNAVTDKFGHVVLIVGGHDKGLDFTPLKNAIVGNPKVKALVVIGQVQDKILKAVSGFTGSILTGAKNMTEIISQANSVAAAGDAVLFSPGTSSFDMFKNESDRGEQFVREVNSL